ncbi:MAG: hypothetical protein KUG57_12190 [Ilumatobacteraceae bacterium]|nr:hypothetical protein [Ilumatobacteraceae bacterium]
MIVVLTGRRGSLGGRVVSALREQVPDAEIVVADDVEDQSLITDRADVVVDIGSSDYDSRAAHRESSTEFAAATLFLADRLRSSQVVFVSSAMVYGALANNPVPLTEEATLRPDVEFVFARQLASAEELVEQWRQARPGRATCVLRPVVALAAQRNSLLGAALVSGLGRRFAEDDPPSQFLHLDDLASSIAIAVGRRLDGVFNVAPDGWVAGDRVRALSGERRIPMPDRLVDVVGRLRWRFQRGPIPPGLHSYTREPWVVSNGQLRAEGWEPTVTNEQTYVESTEAPWWTMVSPKRRQELALGAGAAAAVVVVAVAFVFGRNRLNRRRAGSAGRG